MVKKQISSIFITLFNRILSIVVSLGLELFFILSAIESNAILHKVLLILLAISCVGITLLFNIKLKVLSKSGESVYLGLFNKKQIFNFKLIKTLRGNTPIVVYTYELDNKRYKAFSMVKLLDTKEVFEELKNYKDNK